MFLAFHRITGETGFMLTVAIFDVSSGARKHVRYVTRQHNKFSSIKF